MMATSGAGAYASSTHAVTRPLGVAVIGCGLIGTRRARTAAAHADTQLRVTVDEDIGRATALAADGCDTSADWRVAVSRSDIDIVVVATPNGRLAEITMAALAAGKHVLIEKPMGRSLDEARRIADAAAASDRVLQIGFNHRYHPAIRRAAQAVHAGSLGRLISLRARYGHGGRPGLEREWRSDPELAGGGELIDQGVHVADLLHWLAGMPTRAFALTRTAVWPIAPLEDNAYGLLEFDDGAVAQLHVSMTQWRNLFSLEVHGERGAVIVEGLGGSYGDERLIRMQRAFEGGAPSVEEERFDGEDASWSREWDAFIAAIAGGPPAAGAVDGVAAMRIIDALYRSARSGAVAEL